MSIAEGTEAGERVLIAEDGATQAQHLAQVLEQHGYRVTSTAGGRLALEKARQHRPDLVISDVGMPDMSGYELCTRIKEDPQLAAVPVILLTALSDPQDLICGLECRADGFILTSYDSGQLVKCIRCVLANSRSRQVDRPGMALEALDRNRELSATRDALAEANRELQQLAQGNEALRQAQHALIQQERLRALGQMASGIAHDINNAISPIALYTEAMLERETLSERARGYLTTIQRAVDDVAQTLGRMREFYRPPEQELNLGDLELNPLVQQVIDLTRSRWQDLAQQRGIMIELETRLADDLPTIRGAENEIRDALTNLIFNAVDALPQGGTIEIRTRAGTLRGPGTEACAHLEVIDSGTGMDEETRRRCLEPFFTTKGERGTGLGLSVVYGMAKRHGADLDIDSAEGRGTTIRLTFRAGGAQADSTGRHPAPLFATRSLRVLLVDDDPALLESLRTSLEDEGHKVTTSNGGQTGIEAFREAQKSGKLFDIVITDFGMPYVDGRQVVASVRAMSPGTPIILLTGWGQHVGGDKQRPLHVDRLLGKPPRIRELRSALAELTGRRATDRIG
jgi:signal transduction histidine kinase